jgi:hypothetical protein
VVRRHHLPTLRGREPGWAAPAAVGESNGASIRRRSPTFATAPRSSNTCAGETGQGDRDGARDDERSRPAPRSQRRNGAPHPFRDHAHSHAHRDVQRPRPGATRCCRSLATSGRTKFAVATARGTASRSARPATRRSRLGATENRATQRGAATGGARQRLHQRGKHHECRIAKAAGCEGQQRSLRRSQWSEVPIALVSASSSLARSSRRSTWVVK